ncbi:DUF5672 family protein [Citrifermentans bremense]|uniref:DUF5672 family protein n=1 Tax=Citrifermentans bremense TaxID=60035 RepID=UPI000428E5C4|nr:DUF5672 family protein [Citrifermentans bremense]
MNSYIKGLVSVGLPTYNRPDSLNLALGIITSQTYRNIEIIVSDNASPDPRVREVVEQYASTDSRITYYRQKENCGVLANADFVLSKAQGEFFTWFSDDDWRAPEFIELLVDKLQGNPNINLAFCDYQEVYADGLRADGYPKTHLGVFKPFESGNKLIRTLFYYWQDAMMGKPNLFYSVFRKAALDSLDIKKITGGYWHLNMDCLIVFSLLQSGPVSITSEVMCTLTCGNQKYYTLPSSRSTSLFSKLVDFLSVNFKEKRLYVENCVNLNSKVFIHILFYPKLLVLMFSIFFRKAVSHKQSLHNENMSNLPKGSPFNKEPKINLPNVTLIAMATRNVEQTHQALVYSCKDICFGSVKLLAHYTPHNLDNDIQFIRIPRIKDIDEWSYKIIYELNDYIDTEFALLVHADGFVVNPSSWQDDFLNYDYIGAPWPLPADDFSYRDIKGNLVRVGNSVSLRSKRLLELPIKLNLPWEPFHGFYNEDGFICVKNRHIYESNNMHFAPLDVAKYFSHEAMIPEIKNIKPFVFHKWAGTNSTYPQF